MIKKTNNSGWILCPSTTYPGTFYYFNVLNGESVWSSNDSEKKVLKNKVTIQTTKGNQLYPEPVTPPDHPSPVVSNYHNTIRTCLPSFGKATVPKYISNVKENIATNCTPNQMPHLVTNTKKNSEQITQTQLNNINVHTCTIPLSKRFEKNINEHFGSINYVAVTQKNYWWKSTSNWSNIGKQSDTSEMQYKRKLATKPLLKESKLKRLFHTNANQDSTKFNCNKVESPKAMPNQILINLDINDLRHVRAKKRRSVEMQDEHSTMNDTNKVSCNIRDNMFYSQKKNISEAPASYIVVDLDVLLEDCDCIKRYIGEDENCHLYIPRVIQNQLKTLSVGEHSDRSRVIMARQLLRKLDSYMPRLNLPENKEDTTTHQSIINCCLEIIKLNNDVVLITKDTELIHTAKLYKIQAYHINDIKYNDVDFNFIDKYKYKQNLFLQNTCDFDPFTISKTVRTSENYCRQNISETDKGLINYSNCTESLINDVFYVNESRSDISDINLNISKLNINDNILNTERKCKNNIIDNSSTENTAPRNENDIINRIDKRENTNITFNNRTEQLRNTLNNTELEHYRNLNFIIKPSNFFDNEDTINILEDKLKQFYIKNNIMEYNLYVRFDEWVCTYEQIIEDFLYIILQKNPQVNQPPPWFLHEGMECLKQIYKDKKYILNIIEKLLYYYDFYSANGTNMKPFNFMKLFGCGFVLVEALENTSPLHISDIKKKLIYLKDMIERPIEELLVDSPIRHNTEDRHTYRYNFVKNPLYVLDYLKKHFCEWKYYNEDYDNTNQMEQEVHKDSIKVLRTFGRHLNKFTINKSKCLSFIKEPDKQTHNYDFQSNDFPKVIRNIKLLDMFEEKIKTNPKQLNYPDIAEPMSGITKYFSENENKAIINDKVSETNDNEIVSINDTEINDSTKDSGFGNNSLHAYSLVRKFLSELSSSFKLIHTFIDVSIQKCSEGIAEENKKNLYEKANETHTHITNIIDKLKIIIQRESLETSTLKPLLIKAGNDDKRTTRYRPVIMKCLEQATILENSLKLMLAITNEEVFSVSSAESACYFINIYE